MGDMAPKPTRAAPEMGDVALVTVELDRKTGGITIHDEFSTPMETWAMLATAAAKLNGEINDVNNIDVPQEGS